MNRKTIKMIMRNKTTLVLRFENEHIHLYSIEEVRGIFVSLDQIRDVLGRTKLTHQIPNVATEHYHAISEVASPDRASDYLLSADGLETVLSRVRIDNNNRAQHAHLVKVVLGGMRRLESALMVPSEVAVLAAPEVVPVIKLRDGENSQINVELSGYKTTLATFKTMDTHQRCRSMLRMEAVTLANSEGRSAVDDDYRLVARSIYAILKDLTGIDVEAERTKYQQTEGASNLSLLAMADKLNLTQKLEQILWENCKSPVLNALRKVFATKTTPPASVASPIPTPVSPIAITTSEDKPATADTESTVGK